MRPLGPPGRRGKEGRGQRKQDLAAAPSSPTRKRPAPAPDPAQNPASGRGRAFQTRCSCRRWGRHGAEAVRRSWNCWDLGRDEVLTGEAWQKQRARGLECQTSGLASVLRALGSHRWCGSRGRHLRNSPGVGRVRPWGLSVWTGGRHRPRIRGQCSGLAGALVQTLRIPRGRENVGNSQTGGS